MGTRDRPKGHAVYDYAGRIAFYEQGCCAWQEAVAAADTPPPPKRVVARDLSGLRTVRGIRLGMAQAAVMHVYGRTSPHRLEDRSGSVLLAYVTLNKPTATGQYGTCGQWQNFVFRSDRLVWMQISNAC